jgi:FG-GAP-like repeat/PKD domain
MRNRIVLIVAVALVVGMASGPGARGSVRTGGQALTNVTITSPLDEGQTAHLTGTIQAACAPTTLHVDWGDGTAVQDYPDQTGDGGFDIPYVYADDNPSGTQEDVYAIQVSLTSACGDTGAARTSTTLQNVAPTMNATLTSRIGVGERAVLEGSYTDPGADSFTLTVDWGDGTVDVIDLAPRPFPPSPGGTPFRATHQYLQQGSFPVDATLTDDDNGSDEISGTVDVLQTRPLIATGPGPGGQPHVLTFDARTTKPGLDKLPYSRSFRGGVRVALGDVTNDGIPDIITAPGAGGGPNVKVFSGVNGSLEASFFAYRESFTGGVFVAAGDLNGDGQTDIVTGTDAGGAPRVRAFLGGDGGFTPGVSFLPYAPGFTGGVRVAVGDVNGDGRAEIITAAGAGGGPHVKVFELSARKPNPIESFFAFSPSFSGGVFVAAGDVNGDGFADIVTGADAGGGPHVKVFDGATQAPLSSFFAFAPSFAGGVRVAAGDVNGDGLADIIVGAGAGGGPHVKVFDADGGGQLASFSAYAPQFSGGVYVAEGRSLDTGG